MRFQWVYSLFCIHFIRIDRNKHHGDVSSLNLDVAMERRSIMNNMGAALSTSLITTTVSASDRPSMSVVTDPNTYSALYYAPPNNSELDPLIIVLHGAGRNEQDIQNLANPQGEHAGLIPSLIESGKAPEILLDKFAVLAPYSYGKPSFYNDSRKSLIDFVQWAIQNRNTKDCPINFDPNRIILFGFSDGATVGVELLTTKRFIGGVICSYGYTGKTLPGPAIDRLSNIPMWVFHSADDVIFDVGNSDRLVQQLKRKDSSVVRYSRFDKDPENLPQRVRGHSMGITASKLPDLYEWMLTLPSLEKN